MNLRQLCTKAVVLVVLGVAGCGDNVPVSNDGIPLGLVTNESVARDAIDAEPMVVGNKVLILSTTVTGGTSSQEAVSAAQLGYTVEVVTPTQWAAKTAADFATYRALILGDPTCGTVSAINAAVANRNVWGPTVNGNIIIVGTDPVYHQSGPGVLTKNSVGFAAAQVGRTGAYLNLSCYYHGVPARTPVALLDQFGTFTVTGVGCYNNAHIVATHPALNALTDANLSGWGCSVHEAFDSFPSANFAPLVIARDPSETTRFPGSISFPDGSHGPPYILAKGATPVACGNSIIEPPEECDQGSLNGVPGNPCSSTCRLHWCGDGVVDPGEECDQGAGNGSGSCSVSCRNLIVNRPPVALCQPLSLVANATCGATGSINNGSYDPDNNLVGCTQSPAGPYGPGTTTVTLTCTDATGLSASCTAGVTVVDTTPPTISCPSNQTAECTAGSAVVNPGAASGSDNCGTPAVTTRGPASYPLGDTTVPYTATDRSGNTATCSMVVSVVDTLAPSINLNGDAHPVLECAVDAYNEAGATANDQCAGDVSSSIAIVGSVDPGTVGNYTRSYTAEDPSGHVSATVTRDVTVHDTLAPALTLNGANPLPLECGVDSYSEPGATASDVCTGDRTSAIAIGGAVNAGAEGSYTLSYSVSDVSGNSSSATRTVTVGDTLPPAITCPAPSRAECVAGSAIVDPGAAAATDACGLASVTPNAAGSYPLGTTSVAYTATDRAGHSSTCSTEVTVSDTLAPSIALNGNPAPVLECAVDAYVEAGATAVDVCAGDVSGSVTRSGSVNSGAVGGYVLAYSAVDPSGNASGTVVRAVSVRDTLAPSLSLNGASAQTLECGVDSYSEAGATAADACAGDLSGSIATSGSVDASAEGSYSVSYSVADPSGNTAAATRSVTVADTLAPSLTLLGDSAVTLECGAGTYTDPGATAADACYGNLTGSIVTSGSVDASQPGSYSVSYSVTDGAGLSASATRTVNVVDTQPPQVTVSAPAVLWPPNHRMETFHLSDCAAIQDLCGGSSDIDTAGRITSISSDEVEDARGNGDGHTTGDIVITGQSTFQLRVEREGASNGRVYGVNFVVSDSGGNTVTGTCRFSVPHDQSGAAAVDDGATSGYTVTAP